MIPQETKQSGDKLLHTRISRGWGGVFLGESSRNIQRGMKLGTWNVRSLYRAGSLNPLTRNDHYSGRTTPLTSKLCILFIYSTNIGTEYFKHGIYSPFFPLQNAVCFIILTYLVPVSFTFYIQCVLKIKKIIPAPKG